MNQDLINVVENLKGTVLLGGAIVQFTDTTFIDALKKIYESGASAEREACAKVCDEQQELVGGEMCCVAMNCATAIRARGQV